MVRGAQQILALAGRAVHTRYGLRLRVNNFGLFQSRFYAVRRAFPDPAIQALALVRVGEEVWLIRRSSLKEVRRGAKENAQGDSPA